MTDLKDKHLLAEAHPVTMAFKTIRVYITDPSHMDEEGSPAVPKDGLFVALPNDAKDIKITVIEKSSHAVEEDIFLAPQAKHFIEEEFEEVFEPDPAIYENDEAFPGRDIDDLGTKTMDRGAAW